MSATSTSGPQASPAVRDFEHDAPLVAALRGGYVASLHRGTVCAIDAGGRCALEIGDGSQPVFIRSAAKPFQAMPAILSGAVDRFGLTERELAVLCSSHHGEQFHVEAVLSILTKAGLSESALACGAHPPIHGPSAADRMRRGLEATAVYNNCSGAHAGMLLACRAFGWDTDGYGDPDHPLQRMTRSLLGRFAHVATSSIEMAVDNCAVPAFRLSLAAAARAFAVLAAPDVLERDERDAAVRITGAMTGYPEMVGGTEAFDTRLMRACQGSLIAKGGAEGFQGLGLMECGLGVALKVSDGAQRAVPPATMRILRRLDALDRRALAELARDEVTHLQNMRGEVIGSLVPLLDEWGV